MVNPLAAPINNKTSRRLGPGNQLGNKEELLLLWTNGWRVLKVCLIKDVFISFFRESQSNTRCLLTLSEGGNGIGQCQGPEIGPAMKGQEVRVMMIVRPSLGIVMRRAADRDNIRSFKLPVHILKAVLRRVRMV